MCMPSGDDVCAAPCCSNAVHVSHAERARRRLTSKGHMAMNVAIVVRPTHSESASGDGAISQWLACKSDNRQNGFDAGEEQ